MPSKIWLPKIEGKTHRVEAKWSSWTGGGKIYVDGVLRETWKSTIGGGLTKIFRVSDKPAVLRAAGSSFVLDVDGCSVESNS